MLVVISRYIAIPPSVPLLGLLDQPRRTNINCVTIVRPGHWRRQRSTGVFIPVAGERDRTFYLSCWRW